jgi:hypothetical protein
MHGGTSLTDAIRQWPTPNTPSGGPNTKSTPTHTGGVDLDGAVLLWACADADVPTNGLLGRQVLRNWPTPSHSMVTEQDLVQATTAGNAPDRPKYSDCFLPDHLTPQHGSASSESTRTSRRRLNPAFVSWLMTWPWWWTHPEPIPFAREAMELWLYRAHWHLSNLRRGPGWKV